MTRHFVFRENRTGPELELVSSMIVKTVKADDHGGDETKIRQAAPPSAAEGQAACPGCRRVLPAEHAGRYSSLTITIPETVQKRMHFTFLSARPSAGLCRRRAEQVVRRASLARARLHRLPSSPRLPGRRDAWRTCRALSLSRTRGGTETGYRPSQQPAGRPEELSDESKAAAAKMYKCNPKLLKKLHI